MLWFLKKIPPDKIFPRSYMDFEQKYQKDPGMNRVKKHPVYFSFPWIMMLFTSSRSGHLFITLKPHHSRHLQFETIKTKKCTTHRALISSFVTCCRKAFQTRGLSGCSRRQDQVRNPSLALTMVTLCKHYLLLLWTNLGTDDWSTRLSSSSHWPGPPENGILERKKK